jgi:hypothetical protein
MASGKVTVQPKALLKLPKELPSNIVSDSFFRLILIILLHHYAEILTSSIGLANH